MPRAVRRALGATVLAVLLALLTPLTTGQSAVTSLQSVSEAQFSQDSASCCGVTVQPYGAGCSSECGSEHSAAFLGGASGHSLDDGSRSLASPHEFGLTLASPQPDVRPPRFIA